MNNIWLRGDNSCQYTGCDYGSCAMPFLLLLSIYKPIFISIPLVLLQIWPGQASIMKKTKWLRGDNSVNILGRILVIVQCPSSYCHLSINQVPLQSLLYLSRQWIWGDNSLTIPDRIMVLGFCPSAPSHLSIYKVLFKCHAQF